MKADKTKFPPTLLGVAFLLGHCPAADLADLGRLFAGHRVDQTGTLVPLPLTVQSNLYGSLRGSTRSSSR